MKRDLELVKLILSEIESIPANQSQCDLNIEGHDKETVVAHLQLLIDAGLVKGVITKTQGGSSLSICGLTWAGHDYLSGAAYADSISAIKGR